MSSFGLGYKLLKRLCEEQETIKWYKAKLIPDMFKPGEQEILEWISQHVLKHHVMPSLDTLGQKFPDVQNFPTPEPSSYYLEHIENRLYYEKINTANVESQKVLKENAGDHSKAMDILNEAMTFIAAHRYRMRIVDVAKEGPSMVLSAYHNAMLMEAIGRFGWPHMDDSSGGLMPGDVVSIIGRPAAGKAQPLYSKVLTTQGFKTMGELKIGDELASVDGAASKVVGIHPQGKKPVYRLSFQDGRSVEASDEHLWRVHYREWDAPKIETTLQLIARLEKSRYQGRLSIDLFDGTFGSSLNEPFSPYLLGVFLGDGSMRDSTPSLTSVDEQIINKIASELRKQGLDLVQWRNGSIQYSASDVRMGSSSQENRLRSWFKKLGLWDLKSEHKHIPEQYLNADAETRWELLRGLMDTDGTADLNGSVSFSSSSRKLAEQVQYLVRSLGGKATLSLKSTTHLDHWRVSIVLQDRQRAFSLDRKVVRATAPRTTHTNHRLTLVSIDYVGDEECQCISVSHPSHLYVTDDFVVTHNTWLVLWMALYNWLNGRKPLVVSMEMAPLPVVQRLSAMFAHTNIGQLKVSGYSSHTYKKFADSMIQMAQNMSGFYVVDGNLAASVDDIYILASQLGCDQVYIDGAYLLKHKNPRLDRYTRVAENIELIKQKTTDLGIPTIASYQFARSAVKGKQKNEEAGIEDIAFSDSIGQIASIVLGLFQDEGVETLESRVIRVLKGRNGEIGQFKINWNFNAMNFSQVDVGDTGNEDDNAKLEYI